MYHVVTVNEQGHDIEIGVGDGRNTGRVAECTFRLANPSPDGIDALIAAYERNLGKIDKHVDRHAQGKWQAASDQDKRAFLEQTGGHGVLWQVIQ